MLQIRDMEFVKVVKVPRDRIGVLIGKNGEVKDMIEHTFGVKLEIDSSSGDVRISTAGSEDVNILKAVEFVDAIAKGFSPERARRLLDDESMLNVIDIKYYTGDSIKALERVKGRIIGREGKARKIIEELTDTYISVHGHYVGIIGEANNVKLATDAVTMIINGSMHSSVYSMLQRARSKRKLDRMKLWEDRYE
jgi:ribosomal RNA assembly protein